LSFVDSIYKILDNIIFLFKKKKKETVPTFEYGYCGTVEP